MKARVTFALKRSEPASVPDFAGIFSEHAPFVLRVLRHLGIAAADLQDQAQEVFVAVFRGLPNFSGRSSVRTWVYGICLRVASNHRRRAHVRRERSVAELPEQAFEPDPHEAFERRQGWPALRRLLDELDAEKREVFVLYELEELPMREVAEACGCPLQTAYSRLHAARRVLLAKFREQELSHER
jgi:RNA polymerase sigma-70 factor, ECF subfamily